MSAKDRIEYKDIEEIVIPEGTPGLPVSRFLKPGEIVEVEEIGVPGLRLQGTGVLVADFGDGVKSALLTRRQIEFLMDVAFLELSVARRPLRGCELRFMRRRIKATQDAMAEPLGVTRGTVVDYERREWVDRQVSLAVQMLMSRYIHEITARWPEALRLRNSRPLDRVMDSLSARVEGAVSEFEIGENAKAILMPAG